LKATYLYVQPSLAFAVLHRRLGLRRLLWSGLAIYAICLGIAALDTRFLNYWLALVLLGVGWNFLFLSGTNLLPGGYRREERFRVQAANDFVVFTVQAIVSLGSGWLLFRWQWNGVLLACLPLLLMFGLLLLRSGVLRDPEVVAR